MSDLYLNRYRVVASSVATPQRFHDLRKICGLTPPPSDLVAVKAALPGTYFGVTIVDTEYSGVEGDEVVGMGRLVGDGALTLYLSDLCVHPEHQGKGLSRLIMDALVSHVDEHCPAAHIFLGGDPPAHERVYPKHGFKQYSSDFTVAMYRWSAQRAKELAESPASKYYKDAEGKPEVPPHATAWTEKQAAKKN